MENYQPTVPLIKPKSTYKMHPLVRLIVISVGFMTDAYDLFVIGIVMVILREIYGEDTQAESILATAVLVGATLGQLFFGLMGDKIGRRKMFIVTLLIITIMAIACALSFPNTSQIYISLGIFRTILGFGIGGEYPLSATLAAEGAKPESRGRQMALVFSMQGWGYVLAPLVVLLLIGTGVQKELVWRITLGVGAIPGILTAYHRFKLHDSHQFKKTQGVYSQRMIWTIIWKEYKWTLLGTAGTWLLFDITFYGNGLFKETVLIILGLSGTCSSQLLVAQLLMLMTRRGSC
jgi:PHS family inorganic phosphate transporter-like MFS transporter